MTGNDAPPGSTHFNSIADLYDELISTVDEKMIAVLRGFARDGRALELGIGTGRVALPLHPLGVEVTGIDNAEQMVSRLRAKPGGESIAVTMATLPS